MIFWAKYILSRVAIFFLMLPVTPFYLLHLIGEYCMKIAEFCASDRTWTLKIAETCTKLDNWVTKKPLDRF